MAHGKGWKFSIASKEIKATNPSEIEYISSSSKSRGQKKDKNKNG